MARKLFQPGQSGNPAGRPKGSKDRRAVFREAIENKAEDLISKAIEMAAAGNEQMLKLLLERILPGKPRGDYTSIDLQKGNLVDKTNKVIEALGKGEIDTGNAHSILQSLAVSSKIYEHEELKKKLEMIEEHLKMSDNFHT